MYSFISPTAPSSNRAAPAPMVLEGALGGFADDDVAELEAPRGCMDGAVMSVLPYSYSMDLHNDPRFFASNVIEKRLAAFSGLSVIASLTTGTALAQCFAISKRSANFGSFQGIVQLLGFLTMGTILFMSLASTLIFVYQSFFTHRLMTAGPTGFELASNFYLHPDMVKLRHVAVKCLGLGLPLLLFSTGCALYVKICEDVPPTVFAGIEAHPVANVALVVFTLGSLVLFYVASKHDRVFHAEYRKRVHHNELTNSVRAEREPFIGQRVRRNRS